MASTQNMLEQIIPHIIDVLHREGGFVDSIIDEIISSGDIRDPTERNIIKSKICDAKNPFITELLVKKPKKAITTGAKPPRAKIDKPVFEPEPVVEPEPEPVVEPEPEPVVEPEPEPAVEPEPEPAVEPEPEPVVEPEPEPSVEPEPEPVVEPEPEPAVQPVTKKKPAKRKNKMMTEAMKEPKVQKVVQEQVDLKAQIDMVHLKGPTATTTDIKNAAKILGVCCRYKATKILEDIERVMNCDFEIPDGVRDMKRPELQKYAKWISFDYDAKSVDIINALIAFKVKGKNPETKQAETSKAPVKEKAETSKAPVKEKAETSKAPVKEKGETSKAPVNEKGETSKAPVKPMVMIVDEIPPHVEDDEPDEGNHIIAENGEIVKEIEDLDFDEFNMDDDDDDEEMKYEEYMDE